MRRFQRWVQHDFGVFTRELSIHNKATLNLQLVEYVEITFPKLLITLETEEREQLLSELPYVVFTTRRNKSFKWLPDPKKPQSKYMWDIIVKIKDSFSQSQLIKFADVPTNAFLATWFCLNVD